MRFQVQGNILEGLHSMKSDSVINESSSTWRDDFIKGDSYQNTKEFKDLWKIYSEARDKRDSLWEVYRKNEEIMKKDGVPKPKEDWDDEDHWQALIGNKPLKFSSEKIASLREENSKILKQMTEIEKVQSKADDQLRIIKARAAEVERKDHKFSKPKKATKSDYKGFDMTDMGVSYYNDLLEKGRGYVAEMSPKEYLLRCAFQIFKGTIESCLNGVSETNAQKYASKMKSGEKFHMPYLNFREGQQEGRHRAVAAYLNGIKLIPVFIVGT